MRHIDTHGSMGNVSIAVFAIAIAASSIPVLPEPGILTVVARICILSASTVGTYFAIRNFIDITNLYHQLSKFIWLTDNGGPKNVSEIQGGFALKRDQIERIAWRSRGLIASLAICGAAFLTTTLVPLLKS
ncbi:MAG: hypothetical protein R3C13_05125 [Hyphomonas sp.]